MSTALVIVFIVLIVILPLLWYAYQSGGRISDVTALAPREVADEVTRFFVLTGWKLEERGKDFLFMRRGASGSTGCLLLLLFFPLGLAYLLTDWGQGKLTISYWKNDEGDTEVEFDWSNAAIRGRIGRFVEWLEEQDEDDEEEAEELSDA